MKNAKQNKNYEEKEALERIKELYSSKEEFDKLNKINKPELKLDLGKHFDELEIEEVRKAINGG